MHTLAYARRGKIHQIISREQFNQPFAVTLRFIAAYTDITKNVDVVLPRATCKG